MDFEVPTPRNAQEALRQANVNHRAQRLFADGYTLREHDGDRVDMVKPNGKDYYILSRLFVTCTCPHYREHQFCKHLLGLPKLEKDTEEYHAHLASGYDANAEEGLDPYHGTNCGGWTY